MSLEFGGVPRKGVYDNQAALVSRHNGRPTPDASVPAVQLAARLQRRAQKAPSLAASVDRLAERSALMAELDQRAYPTGIK